MIAYEEALARVLAQAARQGETRLETVSLARALGRVCGRLVRSRESLPSFDNSSMDGYAVAAASTRDAKPGAPVLLPVSGSSAAGDPPRAARAGACWEINTGAPLPRGLDAVVRLEDAELQDGRRAIAVTAPAERGDWVRRKGADYPTGAPVLRPGERVDARRLAVLSALGVTRLAVRRRPRVALLSTGSELARPGMRLAPGRIRNATAGFLEAFLAREGAELLGAESIPDEPDLFARALRRALAAGADAVVSTGAVSVGRHDFVAATLRAGDARVLYHGVAIRPGKPGLLARLPGGAAFFGLPGNPVSTIVGARFFLLPFLRSLLGQRQEKALPARLSAPADKPQELLCFFKARARLGPAGLEAAVLEGQASFQLKPLLEAQAWAVLPAGRARLEAGAAVSVFPLEPEGFAEALA